MLDQHIAILEKKVKDKVPSDHLGRHSKLVSNHVTSLAVGICLHT